MGVEHRSRCPSCGAPTPGGDLCLRCQVRTTGTASWIPTSAERANGILLEGKYRLLDELGRGGMGTVFRAYDESLDRVVAVKFLLPELQTDAALVERFRREAKAMASVRHQNVLQIFSFGRQGSTYFFVMEYIDGQTLEDLLESARDREEFLPVGHVLKLLEQAAAGLDAVHRAGVVHRDIKPANIMVDNETQRAVIMDFGIGKRYSQNDMKRTQAASGTPAYMAPEVVSGKEISSEEDHLSDIYAFGVTAFEALTSSLPFEAESWVDLCVKHVTEAPPKPSSRRSHIPAAVDDIVLRCLAKAPQERYESCAKLRDALREQRQAIEPKRATPLPPHLVEAALRRGPTTTDVTKKARIIAADPDAGFRYSVYQTAHDIFPNCRFLAARTNAKAFELALDSPPLILFAPLDDPEMNGLELAASLSGHIELEQVRLVLTADRITAGERRMLKGLGVTEVLLKPVAEGSLHDLMLRAAHEANANKAGDGSARGA